MDHFNSGLNNPAQIYLESEIGGENEEGEIKRAALLNLNYCFARFVFCLFAFFLEQASFFPISLCRLNNVTQSYSCCLSLRCLLGSFDATGTAGSP